MFAKLPDYDAETDQYNTLARHYTPMGRWMSPDPGGLKVVRLDDPQTWNMYAYAHNNPTTVTDPSGLTPPAQCVPNCTLPIDGPTIAEDAGMLADDDRRYFCAHNPGGCGDPLGKSVGPQLIPSEQNSSDGGFWSRLGQHLGNLFHGHSWNYGMRESVTTRIMPGSESNQSEPNPSVAVGTDALGIFGEATGRKGLGYVGSLISIANDHSFPNLVMTGFSLAPEIGGPVGAVAAVQDVGLLVGQWITNNITAPIFNAAPPDTINVNGHTLPDPDDMYVY
jgi:RHS repeat-associated protein